MAEQLDPKKLVSFKELLLSEIILDELSFLIKG